MDIIIKAVPSNKQKFFILDVYDKSFIILPLKIKNSPINKINTNIFLLEDAEIKETKELVKNPTPIALNILLIWVYSFFDLSGKATNILAISIAVIINNITNNKLMNKTCIKISLFSNNYMTNYITKFYFLTDVTIKKNKKA